MSVLLMAAMPGVGAAQVQQPQEGVYIPEKVAELTTPPPPATQFPALTGVLVTIEERKGVEILARVVSLTDTRLFVTVSGARRDYWLRSLDRVSVSGDSVMNGALIGAAVGILWGALSLQGSNCIHCAQAGGQIAAGIGAGIGTGIGIDKAHTGRTTIYSRRDGLRKSRLPLGVPERD